MHDPIVNMIELHQAGTCRCVTGDRPPVSGMSWLGDEQALSASMGTDQGPPALTDENALDGGWLSQLR